jgi:predicted Zn-dependent protease with MMP-like domain
VPLHRSPSEVFDDLVIDAVEELEDHLAAEIADVEFAVEEVPPTSRGSSELAGVIADRGVPLGRLYRDGLESVTAPVIVVYRRPIEARASDRDDCGDLVFVVVAELVAELLGRDLDDIDPD